MQKNTELKKKRSKKKKTAKAEATLEKTTMKLE